MNNEIDKRYTSMANQFKHDATQVMEEAYHALVENSSDFLARVPEDVFRNYFLPYFIGTTTDKTIADKWIALATTPTAEVIVVDRQNNELFRVPPMADSSAINTTKGATGQVLNEMVTEYKLREKTIPIVGENYLRNAMGDKMSRIGSRENVLSKHEEQWNKIFKLYGVVPKPLESETPTTQTINKDKSLIDDVEY